jgi:hypothetical protein
MNLRPDRANHGDRKDQPKMKTEPETKTERLAKNWNEVGGKKIEPSKRE